MKRFLILMLALCCLLLGGCGAGAAQKQFDSFSADLAAKEELSFTADLSAAYPDRTVSFTLSYQLRNDQQRLTVLSPGEISGITAIQSGSKPTLEYDGLILDTGNLNDYGLTPMSALPMLVDAMRNGHADALWTGDGKTVVHLLYDDHVSVQVWMEEGMIPCRAELISDGVVTVECQISNWT